MIRNKVEIGIDLAKAEIKKEADKNKQKHLNSLVPKNKHVRRMHIKS